MIINNTYSVKSTKNQTCLFCQSEFLIKRVSLNCGFDKQFTSVIVVRFLITQLLNPPSQPSPSRGRSNSFTPDSLLTTHENRGNTILTQPFTPAHNSLNTFTPYSSPPYRCLLCIKKHYKI